jgi:MFS family permease
LIVGSSALAPLVGGQLVARFDWRALFACTAPVGVLFAVLALLALPDSGDRQPEERGSAHFWPYLIFAFAQGALQIVMQQAALPVVHQFARLILLTILGIGALAWFAYHQWHEPNPLVRLHALREKTFQAGIVLYMFYYYQSTAFSYLISRFLESGLGYPVENTGRLVGVTSLISGQRIVRLSALFEAAAAQEVDHRAGLRARRLRRWRG